MYIDISGVCLLGCKVIYSWSCVKMSWDVVRGYIYKERLNKVFNINCFLNKYFWNLIIVNIKNFIFDIL